MESVDVVLRSMLIIETLLTLIWVCAAISARRAYREYQRFCEENAQALAALDKGVRVFSDTQRLDFIEKMAKESYTGVGFDSTKDYDAQTPREYRMMWHHTLNDYVGSIRGAIDVAMRKAGVR